MAPDPIVAITEAVAEARGTRPTELDLVLNDFVSTEAIRLLAASGSSSWRLTFRLPEETVTVTGDGAVLVDSVQRRQAGSRSVAED